jgi:hypothetical protein
MDHFHKTKLLPPPMKAGKSQGIQRRCNCCAHLYQRTLLHLQQKLEPFPAQPLISPVSTNTSPLLPWANIALQKWSLILAVWGEVLTGCHMSGAVVPYMVCLWLGRGAVAWKPRPLGLPDSPLGGTLPARGRPPRGADPWPAHRTRG